MRARIRICPSIPPILQPRSSTSTPSRHLCSTSSVLTTPSSQKTVSTTPSNTTSTSAFPSSSCRTPTTPRTIGSTSALTPEPPHPASLPKITYEIRDTVTKTFGTHTLKAGLRRRGSSRTTITSSAEVVPPTPSLASGISSTTAPIYEGVSANPATGGQAIVNRYLDDHYYCRHLASTTGAPPRNLPSTSASAGSTSSPSTTRA